MRKVVDVCLEDQSRATHGAQRGACCALTVVVEVPNFCHLGLAIGLVVLA